MHPFHTRQNFHLLLLLVVLLLGASPASAQHSVNAMPNLTFSPSTLTINVGDTVTFSNSGGFHNVVGSGAATFRCANGCDGEGGNGNASAASWSFTRTFNTPGVVNFLCEVHSGSMNGTITVTGGGGGNQPGELRLVSAAASRSESGGNFTVQVERTGGDDGAVSVDYATSNGSATVGSDYTATSGTLQFADNVDGTQNVTIPILDDSADEADETLSFTLSNPTGGATLGNPTAATLTILDDENPTPQPGTLGFTATSFSANEISGNATISVSRSGGTDGAVSALYATSPGSAGAGTDYTPVNGTLSWANGEGGNKTFQVPVLDDTASDGNKTVNLLLQNPGGGANLGTSSATLTITDNEQTACVPSTTELCLGANNRFEVRVHWMDFVGGMDNAQVVTIGRRDSGLFYFFDPNNIEMLVKILDGCAINGHFWVFYAATTNVGFRVDVRDTMTAFRKPYENALGTSAPPVLDIEFEACP